MNYEFKTIVKDFYIFFATSASLNCSLTMLFRSSVDLSVEISSTVNELVLSSRVLTNALDNGAFKKNNRICGALLTPLSRKGFRRGNF